MYKGCTRDSQGNNTLTTPEQYRSNTLSPGLYLAWGGLWNPNRSSSRLSVGSNGANHLGTVELHLGPHPATVYPGKSSWNHEIH